MNFKKASQEEVIGTHLMGYIETSYARLVEEFGEPEDGEYKIDAMWFLKFEDGTIATIYNYKDGYNYLGIKGREVESIRDWHVGGFSKDAVERVREMIEI